MSVLPVALVTHISGHNHGHSGAKVCSKHRVIRLQSISTPVLTGGKHLLWLPRVSSHLVASFAQPRQTTARLNASPAHYVTVPRLTSLLRLTVLVESMSPTDSRFPRSVALMVERAIEEHKQSILRFGKRRPRHLKWLLPDFSLLELELNYSKRQEGPRFYSWQGQHIIRLNRRRISMYQLHKFCQGTNTHRIVDVELNPSYIVQFFD